VCNYGLHFEHGYIVMRGNTMTSVKSRYQLHLG
jgi:hypothetical protein